MGTCGELHELGPDLDALVRRATTHVDNILRCEARQSPRGCSRQSSNLKTAKALRLTIPASVLEGRSEHFHGLIADLIRLKVDVLVPPSTQGGLAAKTLTTTIPIVFVATDPVGTGLVSSLDRLGGNLTGQSITLGDEFAGKMAGAPAGDQPTALARRDREPALRPDHWGAQRARLTPTLPRPRRFRPAARAHEGGPTASTPAGPANGILTLRPMGT